jgi:hypothetical protein
MNAFRNPAARAQRGQALVEFSLSILIFIVILMGIFDVGRAIYMYNGVSEASRDIARRTSIYLYPGLGSDNFLGTSLETRAVIDTHRALIPGMQPVTTTDFECIDIAGDPSTNDSCGSGNAQDYIRVTVRAIYERLTLLGLAGLITLS